MQGNVIHMSIGTEKQIDSLFFHRKTNLLQEISVLSEISAALGRYDVIPTRTASNEVHHNKSSNVACSGIVANSNDEKLLSSSNSLQISFPIRLLRRTHQNMVITYSN